MANETMSDTAVFLFRKGRKNCAEAVSEAWQQVTGKDLDVPVDLRKSGSGRAPEGLCGAIYAALLLAEDDKKAAMAERFADAAGSPVCREIRKMKKLSCTACVALAASLLEEDLQQAVA